MIQGQISLFFKKKKKLKKKKKCKNINCDPSLEPSRRDGSSEGWQLMFTETVLVRDHNLSLFFFLDK